MREPGGPDGPPFSIAYRKRPDWDDSWEPDWIPVPKFSDDRQFDGWEDMPQAVFIFDRFGVEVDLTIAGRDFSAGFNPVLDFALAWQYLPKALYDDPVIETGMSVQGLKFRVAKDGDRVHISSNVHPQRFARAPFHPYRVWLSTAEFEELVEQIVAGAFTLLYDAHPQLHGNRYLNDLKRRIGYRHA